MNIWKIPETESMNGLRNILSYQAGLSLLRQTNLGKRVSSRRKMSRAVMDSTVLDFILFPKK